jgi:hypothetical protein
MVLAVFDIDDPVVHGTDAPAGDEWLAEEAAKIEALDAAHPGVLMYTTRGGYRLVYALRRPHEIWTRHNDATWTAGYESWCNYLARTFGIKADKSCADWTRLYRAPFVVRDGIPQKPSTCGDPANLGVWSPKLAPEDRVYAKRPGETHGAVEPIAISDPSNAYGRARLASAVDYLERCSLSIEGQGGRNTFFRVACYLMRRLRLPLDLAVDLVNEVYNPRLDAAGTTTWEGDELEARLVSARDTSSAVPPGEIVPEDLWMKENAIMTGETV